RRHVFRAPKLGIEMDYEIQRSRDQEPVPAVNLRCALDLRCIARDKEVGASRDRFGQVPVVRFIADRHHLREERTKLYQYSLLDIRITTEASESIHKPASPGTLVRIRRAIDLEVHLVGDAVLHFG